MPDFEQGAPEDPDTRLKGEILASLSTWTADYELVRLELAWAVAQMLMRHVSRTQPLEVYIEWLERFADIAGEQAQELKKAVGEDSRRRLN